MTAHRFLLGRLSLDLAFSGGDGPYARFETLHEPADIVTWFAASPLAVEPAASELGAAKALRRAIWVVANAVVEDRAPAQKDVETINAAAAEPPLVPHLKPPLIRSWSNPSVAGALSNVARDAIELFGDPAQRARLRRCASPDCALIYYDGSRPGRRRWCSTERCGDRMRARAYRARHRA